MKIDECMYCDSKIENLLPIHYQGVKFYICVDCLLFLLRVIKRQVFFDQRLCL